MVSEGEEVSIYMVLMRLASEECAVCGVLRGASERVGVLLLGSNSIRLPLQLRGIVGL